MSEYLLDVRNVKTHFFTDKGIIRAVDGVDFKIKKGETLGIVGESGSGKSVTSMSVMQLVEEPGKTVEGTILFKGNDLLTKSVGEMQRIRGNEISMIFQEPMTSLNPVFKVGEQIMEVLTLHQNMSKGEARSKVIDMLKLVGIPRAERVADDYPHQLSGGMRQRVMIAMALACEPSLLIADEPTTALDVTIQAQILHIMNELKAKLQTAIMLITHDLGVVAQMADHVIVMYCGKVVEDALVEELFANPKHPYTKGLIKSIPSLDDDGDKERLDVIEGMVPHPLHLPKGCYFEPRCPYAIEKCKTHSPVLEELAPNHRVSCFVAAGEVK